MCVKRDYDVAGCHFQTFQSERVIKLPEYTATVGIHIFLAVSMTLHEISPRFTMKFFKELVRRRERSTQQVSIQHSSFF